MKRRALAFLLTLMMLVSVLPMAAFAASYSDTVGHWAESSIDRWTDEGVLNGIGNNLYAPDDYMTRAQASAVFTRLLNLTETGDISNFTDLEEGAWYLDYVAHGVVYGTFNGTSTTTFAPNDYITREQFFTVFARAIGIPEADTCTLTFDDMDQLSSWAQGRVYGLINAGYVNGMSATELAPKDNITRAQVAKVLDRAISHYITADGSYAVSGNGVVVVTAPNVTLNGTFSGRAVASGDNGTVDLKDVNGQPKFFVLKDNVSITNGAVGTSITACSVADNVLATGRSNDKYSVKPDQTVIIPAVSVGGGGGGGGGGGTTTGYRVYADLTMGSLSTPLKLQTQLYTSNQTLDTVVQDLFGVTNTDNASKIKNGFEAVFGHILGKTRTCTVGSDTYTVTVDKTSRDVVITKASDPTTDLAPGFLAGEVAVYNSKMASVAAANGLSGTEWDNFVAACSPANLFDNNSKGGISLKSTDDCFTAWTNVVTTGVALHQALLTGSTDFEKLITSVVALDTSSEVIGSINTLFKDTDGFLADLTYTSNKYTAVNVSETVSNAADMQTVLNKRLSRDYSTNEVAQAIMNAAEKEGAAIGTYSLNIYALNNAT